VVDAPPPAGVKVIVPVYVPWFKPDRLADAVSVAGVVPDVGVTDSQFPATVDAAAVKLAAAEELETPTCIVRGAGFDPPSVPENVRLTGLAVSVGEAATVRVTGIVKVPFGFAAPCP
jgi:hypothetical protein